MPDVGGEIANSPHREPHPERGFFAVYRGLDGLPVKVTLVSTLDMRTTSSTPSVMLPLPSVANDPAVNISPSASVP